jgi:hypothetical protein
VSFTTIDPATIAAGQAVKQELLSTVKGDFDDHESRIIVMEASIGRLPPIEFAVVGTLNSPLSITAALAYRIEANLTITAARLFIKTAGTSGSVSVDVEYKRGAGAWTTILSAPISAGFASGSYYVTSGTLAVQNFLTGDLLRLNISAVQDGMEDFAVFLENEGA